MCSIGNHCEQFKLGSYGDTEGSVKLFFVFQNAILAIRFKEKAPMCRIDLPLLDAFNSIVAHVNIRSITLTNAFGFFTIFFFRPLFLMNCLLILSPFFPQIVDDLKGKKMFITRCVHRCRLARRWKDAFTMPICICCRKISLGGMHKGTTGNGSHRSEFHLTAPLGRWRCC